MTRSEIPSALTVWAGAALAAFLLIAVKGGLRLAPGRTLRLVSRGPIGSRGDANHAMVERWSSLVRALGRIRPLRSDCLSRSLTVLAMARLAGMHPTLVIGARRAGRTIDAHAWLECGSLVVPPQSVAVYERLWTGL